MADFGFIQKREESDESFNLRILSATITSTARELLEDRCSGCTHLDKFECLINPKCTLTFRAKRVSEDGIHFHWKIEAWLERDDRKLTWADDEDAWGQVSL
jgi:hypothetical protein